MDQFSELQKPQTKPWWEKIAKVYPIAFLMALVFFLGVILGISAQESQSPEKVFEITKTELLNIFEKNDQIDPELFGEVWDKVHNEYIDKSKVSDVDLFYGALSGMVRALGDPHSIFLNPEFTKRFNEELDGSFFGIGAEIGKRNGFLVIVAPLADTPAEKAGLKAGDKILEVDGRDTADMTIDEAVSQIKGDKGTKVVLTILSSGDNAAREIAIIRDKIDVPSVIYKVEDNIAIVRITNFNRDTAVKFNDIAQKIVASNPEGIILDMRNNPGGFLNVAVEISSHWLDPGQVVVRETFSDKSFDTNYDAVSRTDLSGFKTVVLVNQGSASASEIVAGVLQDYDLADIVGMRTYGKGSVQELMELSNGSSVKLTVAKWLTPNGRTIENEGIEPDFEVDLTLEDFNNDVDPQLDKAKSLILQP